MNAESVTLAHLKREASVAGTTEETEAMLLRKRSVQYINADITDHSTVTAELSLSCNSSTAVK